MTSLTMLLLIQRNRYMSTHVASTHVALCCKGVGRVQGLGARVGGGRSDSTQHIVEVN